VAMHVVDLDLGGDAREPCVGRLQPVPAAQRRANRASGCARRLGRSSCVCVPGLGTRSLTLSTPSTMRQHPELRDRASTCSRCSTLVRRIGRRWLARLLALARTGRGTIGRVISDRSSRFGRRGAQCSF
jgi:hypothetical protein